MLTDTSLPVLLALDTSTDRAAIGLKQGASFTELAWPAGRSQTTSLLMAIDWLLGMSHLTTEDLAAVAVATGPGTFTGLRVGMSLAKGLVLACDLPLIGIPTLDVTAFPYQAAAVSVCALLPAGRGRVVWAISEAGGDLSAPINSTVPELIEMLKESPHLLVVGEILDDHRQELEAARIGIEPEALGGRRPAVLAQLAWDRWQTGDVDDATLLEPTYVHGQRATIAPITDRLLRKAKPARQ
ncbi:MAG: tRNA (adenosine(37)-N6)-threonylcarbamoyltransferase complex dimerization subunit type 1 TsaB [Thermomicrobiales bacterium]